jgi:hypothetical protein
MVALPYIAKTDKNDMTCNLIYGASRHDDNAVSCVNAPNESLSRCERDLRDLFSSDLRGLYRRDREVQLLNCFNEVVCVAIKVLVRNQKVPISIKILVEVLCFFSSPSENDSSLFIIHYRLNAFIDHMVAVQVNV